MSEGDFKTETVELVERAIKMKYPQEFGGWETSPEWHWLQSQIKPHKQITSPDVLNVFDTLINKGGMTIQERCEIIYYYFKVLDPEYKYTPEDIATYSPTGELYKVFDWFHEALFHFLLFHEGKIVKCPFPENYNSLQESIKKEEGKCL